LVAGRTASQVGKTAILPPGVKLSGSLKTQLYFDPHVPAGWNARLKTFVEVK
jgi:hypothetical protein